MRTLTLVLGLMVVSLSGCGTTSGRRDSPATDLEVLRLGVKHLTEKRRVEGSIQHRDEAETNGQLWNYAGRLEDKSELDDGDKDRLRSFIDEALDAIQRSRQAPCHPLNLACRWSRRKDP